MKKLIDFAPVRLLTFIAVLNGLFLLFVEQRNWLLWLILPYWHLAYIEVFSSEVLHLFIAVLATAIPAVLTYLSYKRPKTYKHLLIACLVYTIISGVVNIQMM